MKYAAAACALALGLGWLACGAAARAEQGSDNWLKPPSEVKRTRYVAQRNYEANLADPFADDEPADKATAGKPGASKPATGKPTPIRPEPEAEDIPTGSPYSASGCQECLGNCDSCGECEQCCPFMHGGHGFGGIVPIAGAEYLYLRPTFSQAIASVDVAGFGGPSPVARHEMFDFGYESGVRAFAGFAIPGCCEQFLFTFTGISSAADNVCGPADLSAGEICLGPCGLVTQDGDSIEAHAEVNINTFDLEYGKTVTFGGADCNCCPPWAITWWAGARIVDAGWHTRFDLRDDSGALDSQAGYDMTFDGAGPRVGLKAQRYFGQSRAFSVFAKGNISLLLGSYDLNGYLDSSGVRQEEIQSSARLVPVTELEVGGSYEAGPFSLSAGYLFQAWHDLGMTYQISNSFDQPYDDANILAFDGLFVRAQVGF